MGAKPTLFYLGQFEGGKLKTNMKYVAGKLLLILFGAFIGLSVCETALRLLGHKDSGSTYTADPLLGWSLRPGARVGSGDLRARDLSSLMS